jgi:hypothetical protein
MILIVNLDCRHPAVSIVRVAFPKQSRKKVTMASKGFYTLSKSSYREKAPAGDYVRISQYPTVDMSNVQRRRRMAGSESTVMTMKSQEDALQSKVIPPLSPLQIRKTRPNACLLHKASENTVRTVLPLSQSRIESPGADLKLLHDPGRASTGSKTGNFRLSLENKGPPLSNTRPRKATPSPTSSLVTIAQPSFRSSSPPYNHPAFHSATDEMAFPSVTKKLSKGANRIVTQLRKLSKGKKYEQHQSPAVMEGNNSNESPETGQSNTTDLPTDIPDITSVAPLQPHVSNTSMVALYDPAGSDNPPIPPQQQEAFYIASSSASSAATPSILQSVPFEFVPAANPIAPLQIGDVPTMIPSIGLKIAPELHDVPTGVEQDIDVTITSRGEVRYPFQIQDGINYNNPPLAAAVIMDQS